MKLGKIYTFENASEAKKLIGKRVIAGDCLAEIAGDCLEDIVNYIPNRHRCILDRIEEEDFYPFCVKNGSDERFQFIREIIEEDEPTLMTNKQLSEWLARGFGQYKYYNDRYSFLTTNSTIENKFVEEPIRIRPWNSDEWVKPTLEIYERDCKGKTNE